MWWRRLKVWSAEKMRQQIIITDVTISIVTIVTSKLPLLFQGTLGQHCQGSGSQCPCQRWTFELPPSFVIIIIINAKHPYFVPICGEPTQKSLMIFLGSNLACCSGPFNKNIVAMTTKINHQPWAGPSGIRNFNLGWDFCKIRDPGIFWDETGLTFLSWIVWEQMLWNHCLVWYDKSRDLIFQNPGIGIWIHSSFWVSVAGGANYPAMELIGPVLPEVFFL